MKRILLPDGFSAELSFYLAMEEFAARYLDADVFFLWRTAPTVIVGRNQNLEAEVGMDFCRRNGIRIFRRRSGGGCVYSDWGNIMISYVTGLGSAEILFRDYLSKLASALADAGVPAEVSGRNDILADGRKVSGNAFRMLHDRSIIHGTLLFDTDLDAMEGAITPAPDKLSRKGVASVRQRVADIGEYTDMTVEEFMEYLSGRFCDGEIVPDAFDFARIRDIERKFLSDDFISGKTSRTVAGTAVRIERTGHAENAGNMKAVFVMQEENPALIDSVEFSGDYFLAAGRTPEDLNMYMTSLLKGIPLEAGPVVSRMNGADIGEYIAGLTDFELVDIIAGKYGKYA